MRWTSAQLAAKHAKPAKPTQAKAGLSGQSLISAKSRASCLIGIDPGTHTGIAIKEGGLLRIVETTTIWKAINLAHEWAEYHGKGNTLVRVEDARLRTWFGDSGPEKWKGAGSIGRDCAIWVEVLTELEMQFELVHPKAVKATTAEQFERLTGWKGRTSIHAREAAYLVI